MVSGNDIGNCDMKNRKPVGKQMSRPIARMVARSVVRRVVHTIALLTRPMTLGARVLITDDDGRILLLEHTYVPGWYLPGGGVDRGETTFAAANRELVEETGIAAEGLSLFGFYYNVSGSRRDHVALFVAKGWIRKKDIQVPNREIRQIGFFPRDSLPEGTTSSTRRRLAEVFDQAPISEYW